MIEYTWEASFFIHQVKKRHQSKETKCKKGQRGKITSESKKKVWGFWINVSPPCHSSLVSKLFIATVASGASEGITYDDFCNSYLQGGVGIKMPDRYEY